MSLGRRCTRTACAQPAVATLTYVYADQTAVLGPLSTHAEPHAYDLCAVHAARMSVPKGWNVVRLPGELRPADPTDDDLLALANAVREAARPEVEDPADEPGVTGVRRGHLRAVRSE